MKSFVIAATAGLAAAVPATIFTAGDAPRCFVTDDGNTRVEYEHSMSSFKCSHTGSTCACTATHPTHEHGGCRQLDHTDGSTHSFGGDCTDSGATWHIKKAAVATSTYGAGWEPFWWFNGVAQMNTADVLGQAYGTCGAADAHCYGRLPTDLTKDATELLAMDDSGNVFKWDFGVSTTTAKRAWGAFHDHAIQGVSAHTGTWQPTVLAGSWSGATQDTFMYREQNGVKSFLLDDDTCDCHSTLSAGHGMCGSGYSATYGAGYTPIGVDELSDDECLADSAPKSTRKLMLLYRKKAPIDGVWSGWTASGSCSSACGNGRQTYTRTCDGKAYGGKDCSGDATKTESCLVSQCKDTCSSPSFLAQKAKAHGTSLTSTGGHYATTGGSAGGKACVFPFTYGGKTYNSCTSDSHNQAWCSTDAVFAGSWGNCGTTATTGGSAGGASCAFPFTYNGVVYDSCTTTNHNQLWCSTDSTFSGSWGNCPTTSVDTYQQWNDFLNAQWACDACAPGTSSVMRLHKAQIVTGWKRAHGGVTTSQKWRLEGSMTNGNFKPICPETHFDSSNSWQSCTGGKVLYVKLVKAAGGGGVWNGPIQLQGCAAVSGNDHGQCDIATHSHDSNNVGTSLSDDSYQQWNQFLSATWACDSCQAGTHSTLALEKAQKITGWKMASGSVTPSQRWHLEASMTNSNFKTVCSGTTLTTDFQECIGTTAKYVRLVKDAGGGGHWNGRIQLEGCATCDQPQILKGGSKISSGSTYQRFDDFLNHVWACDNCAAGTASVMKLPETRTINGWGREDHTSYRGESTSQRWRLEGSMTNGNWKTICSETSLNNDMQACDGSSVNYVRLVKTAGGSGPWNHKIVFDGCSPTTEAKQCTLAAITGATVFANSGRGSYQQFDNFMGTTWACDNCAAKTWSTMKLAAPKKIHGWRRSGAASHTVTDAQGWHLEGSNSPTSDFKTICSSTVLSNKFQSCSGAEVAYVRLVKDRGGGGMWNGKIELQGC